MKKILTVLAVALLTGGSLTPARADYTNNTVYNVNQAIPDGDVNGLGVTANITGLSGNIASVTLTVNILGGNNADLYAFLAGPNGGFSILFNRVGLAGCVMGACAILPRIIGLGRASDWLYSGRSIGGEEAERSGFLNRLVAADDLLAQAHAWAADLAAGPTFANGITKTMLHQEWSMSIDQAIEAEAQAQAICMMTGDFKRAYQAFVAKQRPVFEGN